ncbi:hypothetical protein BCR37DRAFT_391301 [Protomyces lactucae-debilis]|uniref:NAD(P)-binding domain-containing protein n=1 Tax=Protomyces lactucae-debilis TaxID=2754530 RepID=A0A1Y2FPK0_PROLT|nr:uncharacterized protein BCR37DRAFT_391301 [Protomyces lactucae-debilis]ORY85527.1 hypothetical protein BCR37DRAFT_391301 [Protomyces lactucae-debilis]
MIGITGATGALSSAVLTHLSKGERPLRLLARNTEKAAANFHALKPRGPFDVKYCDYQDKEACVEALKGIETVLFVSAGESPDRVQHHKSFIDAMCDAGVKSVIYTSFRGAAPDAVFHLARDHYWTEEYMKSQKSLNYILLRNAFYQDVLPDFTIQGAIRGPGGSGRLSPVARQDVASVIVKLLDDVHPHIGKTYNLTGPEELTFSQIATMLGADYVEETMEEARDSRKAPGVEDWLIEAWISTYTAVRDGEESGLTDDVERITGQPATTMQAFLALRGEK